MNIFVGLLILAGLGALAFAIYKGFPVIAASLRQSSTSLADSGVSQLAKRLSEEGILSTLLPSGTLKPALAGGVSGGVTDPASWGSAVKNLTSAGIDIYKQINSRSDNVDTFGPGLLGPGATSNAGNAATSRALADQSAYWDSLN